MSFLVITAVVIALLFNFLNGMNDAANAIATIAHGTLTGGWGFIC